MSSEREDRNLVTVDVTPLPQEIVEALPKRNFCPEDQAKRLRVLAMMVERAGALEGGNDLPYLIPQFILQRDLYDLYRNIAGRHDASTLMMEDKKAIAPLLPERYRNVETMAL